MSGATRSERGKLGGLKRLKVMRALATGEQSQSEIAERFGVTQQAISDFGKRHAQEIQEIRENLADEWAGLWITRKADRLAMYEEIATQALVPVPKVTPAGKVAQWVNPETGEVETLMETDGRLAAQMGKQAAEELGQLVARTQVSGDMNTTTTYKIEGIDPEAMK